MCASDEEDKDEMQAFYQSLYTSQGPFDPSALLDHLPVRVSPEMNEFFTKPFEPKEIHPRSSKWPHLMRPELMDSLRDFSSGIGSFSVKM